MKFLKLLTAILTFASLTIITFYSCKKKPNEEITKQNQLVDFYKQKLKSVPTTTKFIVNLQGKGYYGDINGNKINYIPGQTNKTAASSCPDPGTSEFSQVLVSITKEYTCNVGYRFVIQYKITSEFYPLLTSGTGQPSKGRIKLVNSSGNQVYITPTSMTNPVTNIQNNGMVGQNSNGADLNEFLVTYRSEIVSESTYNLSSAVQCNLTCYTDCSNYPTLNIGFSSQQQITGLEQNSLPCLRIDKVYWNPRNGSSPPSLAGCDPVGSSCFPYGYVFPNKQEIQFLNSSGVWTSFYLYTQGLLKSSTQVSLINFTDVFYIDVATSQTNGLIPGNVQVRYRNNQMGTTSNGGPCVTQPTGTYVTETWVIN